MPKKELTIRVINFTNPIPNRGIIRNELPGVWVEQLRYMGHVRELATFTDPDRSVLEFYAPRGADQETWCRHNADRMASFGINAVVAPKWGGYPPLRGDNAPDQR